MLAVMTGDDSYFNEVLEMAHRDARRADLQLIETNTNSEFHDETKTQRG